MRVIVLQDLLRGGGTERQAIELTHGLLKKKHHAELWVAKRGGPLEPIGSEKLAGNLVFLNQNQATGHVSTALQIRARLAKIGEPYILLLMGRWAHLIANALHKPKHARWVSTVRTSRKLPQLYRRTIQRSDQLITNSKWALDETTRILKGKRPRSSTVIHNGLSREELLETSREISPDTRVLINAARLEPGKGQEDLIRMLPKILDEAVQLWLLGTGPCAEQLTQLSIELGLQNRVHFHGFRENIADYYAQADIFVSASGLDSLPNALIEAHAAGLPIVAYDTVGIPEIVNDKESGFLCSDHTPEALAMGCRELLDAPRLREQFGTAARELVRKRFDRERQNETFLATLENLLEV